MTTMLRLLLVILALFGSLTVALGQIDAYSDATKNAALSVTTPHGLAIQADSAAAWAARGYVKSGGTLFRIGTMGKVQRVKLSFGR